MLRKTYQHGRGFTMPVGVYANGSDPASIWPIAHPIPLRTSVRMGRIRREGRRGLQALMTVPATGVAGQTGSLTVANNNFTLPAHVILGEYTLISSIDFTPGVGVNQTATALAAAISRLPGFQAVAVLAVVSITYDSPQVEVPFRVWHTSALVTNFTPLVPTGGTLTTGVPQVGSPVITP